MTTFNLTIWSSAKFLHGTSTLYYSATSTLTTPGFTHLRALMESAPRALMLTGMQILLHQEVSRMTDQLILDTRLCGSSPKAYKQSTTLLCPTAIGAIEQ